MIRLLKNYKIYRRALRHKRRARRGSLYSVRRRRQAVTTRKERTV